MRVPTPVNIQGTLGAGSTVLYTCPAGYFTNITTISFNNPAAYDFQLTVTRVTPASTVTAYDFVLAAGDVIADSTMYTLLPGDSITAIVSVAGTNYFMVGTEIPLP
jgi:hypothetical protein